MTDFPTLAYTSTCEVNLEVATQRDCLEERLFLLQARGFLGTFGPLSHVAMSHYKRFSQITHGKHWQ